MSERFTERAGQVVILAQDEARALERKERLMTTRLEKLRGEIAELRAERERLHGPAEPPEQR